MYKRYLTHVLREALADTPAILITGARQSGKSTLCKQLITSENLSSGIVTLDDPATLLAATADPLGFLQNLDSPIIIDEVQRAPELFLSIKKLIDEDRLNRRFILTGSADVMTLPRVADSLAGRIEIQHLWPLSQCEIRASTPQFLQTLLSPGAKFVSTPVVWKDLMKMVTSGGFPEALRRATPSRRSRWFESYITALLQKDIRDLSNIEGLIRIPIILQLLAVRVGSTINFSDVGRLAGVKTATFHRYLALLEQVFLIKKIPAWTPNAEGQFVKSPKIILNDTGLLCHLLGETESSVLKNRTMAGKLLENFVLLEILKQLSWQEDTIRPYHFSIHQSAEVDLVLEDSRKRLYGIEIKSSATLHDKDFNGLRKLADHAGDRFRRGIILYGGKEVLSGFGGKNLQAVPLTCLWE